MKKILCDSCGAEMEEEDEYRTISFENDKIVMNVTRVKFYIKDSQSPGGHKETNDVCDLCWNELIRKTYESK